MKRFAALLVSLALVVMGLAATPALAQESDKDKAADKEAAADKDAAPDKDKVADKAKAEPGVAPEVRYPPFSTRFKVLAAGLAIGGSAWAIAYAASRGWPQTNCIVGPLGLGVVPGTGVGNVQPVYCSSGPPGANQLGIPIVGPWIALGKSGCAADEPTCSVAKPVLRGFAYVIDGVVQLGGLGLIVEALAMKTESLSDSGKKSSALSVRYRGVEVTPLPLVGPSVAGLSLSGTF